MTSTLIFYMFFYFLTERNSASRSWSWSFPLGVSKVHLTFGAYLKTFGYSSQNQLREGKFGGGRMWERKQPCYVQGGELPRREGTEGGATRQLLQESRAQELLEGPARSPTRGHWLRGLVQRNSGLQGCQIYLVKFENLQFRVLALALPWAVCHGWAIAAQTSHWLTQNRDWEEPLTTPVVSTWCKITLETGGWQPKPRAGRL